ICGVTSWTKVSPLALLRPATRARRTSCGASTKCHWGDRPFSRAIWPTRARSTRRIAPMSSTTDAPAASTSAAALHHPRKVEGTLDVGAEEARPPLVEDEGDRALAAGQGVGVGGLPRP